MKMLATSISETLVNFYQTDDEATHKKAVFLVFFVYSFSLFFLSFLDRRFHRPLVSGTAVHEVYFNS
jgi:hypothetical protein